jgi:hypothetical protein
MTRDRCFAPTLDHDDAVDVVRNCDSRVQRHVVGMVRDILPTAPGDFAGIVQPHFAVHHMAEETFPIPRADGCEIRPRMATVGARRAVPSQEADAVAMVLFGIVCHDSKVRSNQEVFHVLTASSASPVPPVVGYTRRGLGGIFGINSKKLLHLDRTPSIASVRKTSV